MICNIAVLLLLTATAQRTTLGAPLSPVNLQISVDPDRPLALYEGPPTYRRDSRGRPFNSIIVTSKPFGFGNPASNDIKNIYIGSASATTTTTASPFDRKPSPTIPFFSISCTVGSSCSQIISARKTYTPKPTFKPYTKEEIDKFKGTLSSIFPPTLLTASLGVQPSRNSSRTTTTTSRPLATNSLWRIRTTPPQHFSTSTPITTTSTTPSTTSAPTTRSTTLPSTSWTRRWKWPSNSNIISAENRYQTDTSSDNQQQVTIENMSANKLSSWAAQSASQPQTAAHKTSFIWPKSQSAVVSTTPRPEKTDKLSTITSTGTGGWMSLLAASLHNLQNHHNKNSLTQSQHQATSFSTINKPSRPSPEYYSNSSPNRQEGYAQAWIEKVNLLNNKKPEKVFNPSSIPTKLTPVNYHHHEVISNKGNKISLITGSSNRQQNVKPTETNTFSGYLPPEVSVSSHVIGLRVKPKSLESPNIENVQGVMIETDGENVNLSDLIMKEKVPQRPARYLVNNGDRWHLNANNLGTYNRRSRQQDGRRPIPSSNIEWRPRPIMYFPNQ